MTDEIETDRCTGHCCRDFTLPYTSIKEMKEVAEKQRLDVIKEMKHEKDIAKRNKLALGHLRSDLNLVPDMLIELGGMEFDCNGNLITHTIYHYTCKHLDEETGDCKNYKYRPRMCREYPYGRECQYKGCTRKIKTTENSLQTEKELINA